MPVSLHPTVSYIKINPADKFAIRAWWHNDRLIDQDRFWQSIMRVTWQNDVNARHPRCHFFIDVKTVMRKDNNTLSPRRTNLIHHDLHVFIAYPERIFGKHPARVRDRHVGECLPNHGNTGTTALKHFIRRENFGRLIPFRIKYVLPQSSKRQGFNNFRHPLAAQRKFPVEGHCIRLEGVNHIDHVLTGRLMAGVWSVPSITVATRSRPPTRPYPAARAAKSSELSA